MIVPLALLGLVWLSPQDPFVAQRDAAAALNPRSRQFTITISGGRRTFRPGEKIPLVLAYDDLGRSWAKDEDIHLLRLADVVLDRTDGTAQPFADLTRARLYIPPGVSGCVEGGLVRGLPGFGIGFDANGVPFLYSVPPPPPPKPPPAIITVLLNEAVRFDAPGHYRLYLSDRHEAERIPLNQPRPSLISNIVELEITGREEDWEDRTADAAVAVLDRSGNPEERRQAARTLRFLGSRRAIDEMARRLFRNSKDHGINFELEAGLFGARDRAHAIARMEAQADDSARPMSLTYLRDLAALRVTRTSAGPLEPLDKRRALIAADTRRLRALARAGTLLDRLTATFQATLRKDGDQDEQLAASTIAVTPALAGFAREVETALTGVSPAVQDSALATYRLVFREDARFAPMVERFARQGGTAATVLLNDLAPSRARHVILADLGANQPRLAIQAAGLLTDPALPSLDAVFVRQLQTASDATQFTAALDRIERYGTLAIATPTKQAYLARPDLRKRSTVIPALAFFFRTDPPFAIAELETAEAGDEDWREDLLSAVAARRTSPALEDFAGGLLVGTDPEAAVRAGWMLTRHGSPRTKALVLRGVETWQSRWSADRVRALDLLVDATWESALESRLIWAMSQASRWSLDARDYESLAARCRLSQCREDVSGFREDADRDRTFPYVSTWFNSETGRNTHYIRRADISLERLEAELVRFPAGTSFVWNDDRDYTIESWYLDREAEFRRVDRFLRLHGMSLRR